MTVFAFIQTTFVAFWLLFWVKVTGKPISGSSKFRRSFFKRCFCWDFILLWILAYRSIEDNMCCMNFLSRVIWIGIFPCRQLFGNSALCCIWLSRAFQISLNLTISNCQHLEEFYLLPSPNLEADWVRLIGPGQELKSLSWVRKIKQNVNIFAAWCSDLLELF